jgi:hypothetical protein
MKNNPCLACRMRDEDKNNSLCRKCERRVDYVQQLEEELNFSMSYTNTSIYARFKYPTETRMTGRLRMTLSH